MESSLFRYIWNFSAPQQILVLLLTIATFPLLYVSLELPKIIIDFLKRSASNETVSRLFGAEWSDVNYLLVLSGILCILLLAIGIFKMRINTMKGVIGERMIRRLRFTLLQRMLLLREEKLNTLSQGELVSTITSETEPLAGFIGDSIALPLFQGGTLLTILFFMFAQDPFLGLAAIISIPIQAIVIPRLQKHVNRLGKQRVSMVRSLSARIGEAVNGHRTIRVHGTYRYTLAEFSKVLGDIFAVRFQIFQRKFMMKFINNMIGYLTPVLFYSAGGVLVLQGNITIGALVASLVAYKDLAAPWKELLSYYQRSQDSKIKYEQILDNFSDDHILANDADETLQGISLLEDIHFANVSYTTPLGTRVLRDITATLPARKIIAITGSDGVELRRLVEMLVGLTQPSRGKVLIGDANINSIPAAWRGKKLCYVGSEPFMFDGTIMQNMLYGLRHLPPKEDHPSLARLDEIIEAKKSGNSLDSFHDVWTEFALAGCKDWYELRELWTRMQQEQGMDSLLYQIGLREKFTTMQYPFFAEQFLLARTAFATRADELQLCRYINAYQPGTFNPAITLAENIMFGVALDEANSCMALAKSPQFLREFYKRDMAEPAYDIAIKVLRFLIDLLPIQDPENPKLASYCFVDDEVAGRLQIIHKNITSNPKTTLSDFEKLDQTLLISLFLAVIPAQHGMQMISDDLISALMQMQDALDKLPFSIERYDAGYHHSQLSIAQNVIFGSINTDDQAVQKKISECLEDAMRVSDTKNAVSVVLGLSQVGIGGRRLAPAVRQRIQFNRALVLHPDIIVVHDGLSLLSRDDQILMLRSARELLPDLTLIIVQNAFDEPDLVEAKFVLENGSLSSADKPARDVRAKETPQSSDDAQSLLQQEVHWLAGTMLFHDLDKQALHALALRSSVQKFAAGDSLWQIGDDANQVALIIEGRAQVYRQQDDRETNAGSVSEKEFSGMIEVISQTQRIFHVQAITQVKALMIDGDAVLMELEANPALALRTIRMLSSIFSH